MNDIDEKVLQIDLGATFDLYTSIYGLLLRDRREKRVLKEGLENSFGLVIKGKDENTDNFNVVFKFPELKMKYCEDAVENAKKVGDITYFSTLYAYFGNVLGLYTFLSMFNSKEYTELNEIKSNTKIALKRLIKAINIAEDRKIYYDTFNDEEIEDDKDGDFSNELRIIPNLDQVIEKMSDFIEKEGRYIPTQRILSMTYLSMYYTLLGALPVIFTGNNMSIRQFLEICNTKHGAIDYIKQTMKDMDEITTKRTLGLLYTFYRLTQFYAINCPVFKLDRDNLTNKNLTFSAITKLGEVLENLPKDDDSYLKYRTLYLELLKNNVFNAEISLEELISVDDYISCKGRSIMSDDISSSAIIGYDLSLLIVNISRLDFGVYNKGYANSNPMYLNLKYMDSLDLLLELPYSEIETYVTRELGADSNCIVSPETITRLVYFAGIARYSLANSRISKNLSDEKENILNSIIVHAESIIIRLYNEWFIRKDRVYKTEKRYMVEGNERINQTLIQLNAEIDFIILNYCEFVIILANENVKEPEEGLLNISENIRRLMAERYLNGILYVSNDRGSSMIRNIIDIPSSINTLFEAYVMNDKLSALLKLFESNNFGASIIDLHRLFLEIMVERTDSEVDTKRMREFMDENTEETREVMYDIRLYRKIVSSFNKIRKSNLTDKEKFILTWGLILFFVNRKFGDSSTVEETSGNNAIVTGPEKEVNPIDEINNSAESFIERMYPKYVNNNEIDDRGFYEKLLGKRIK